MKYGLTAALAALAVQMVNAHYAFPWTIYNSVQSADWQYIRLTDNHVTSAPVTDVTSQAIRCYETTNQAAATSTQAVTAGSSISFRANNNMGHPGYFSAYMTAASPAANSESAGTGSTWFKIWEQSPVYNKTTYVLDFPIINVDTVAVPIPKSIPNGQYLIRFEQIALHLAGTVNAAQFYIGCAQVTVSGGGSGKPTPLTSFPGAYKATDPGILINIYALPANFTTYPAPGPAVWKG